MDKQLIDRKEIYGNFDEIALISQQLKNIVRTNRGYNLSTLELEAIEMILHKIARAIKSKKKLIDTYRDIAGYANLVVEHLKNCEDCIDSEITYKEVDNDL